MADEDTVASKFTKEVKYKTKALGCFGFSCNGLTRSSPHCRTKIQGEGLDLGGGDGRFRGGDGWV